MIEKPPIPDKATQKKIWKLLAKPKYDSLFNRINNEYLYWDKVKYKTPSGVNPIVF